MLYTYFEWVVGGGVFLGTILVTALLFRRVVATNEVHIVQSAKSTTSYGKDTKNGNTYYQWPSWIPILGVTKIVMPVSVFDLDLVAYEAFDKGKLPFVVDVKAFFRIAASNMAAERVASFEELHNQLKAIVQGAVRTILANNEIEEIMQGRSTFGDQFTKEVNSQLSQWGVETVKNIELMDIRDGRDSHVIRNIMEKKKSHIEMESRVEVAKNRKSAEIAETIAVQEINVKKQEAQEVVGVREADAIRKVEIAKQEAEQSIKEATKLTKEKQMAVIRVEAIKMAEINKDAEIIKANKEKETAIISSEGKLEAKKREAYGISAEGAARAEAETAMKLAPVQAQITLAEKIDKNKDYLEYLINVEKIKASQAIGIEQAKALEKASIKIISNSGEPVSGLTGVMDLFSSKGGTKVGAMLEALEQTETGKKLVDKFVNGSGNENPAVH